MSVRPFIAARAGGVASSYGPASIRGSAPAARSSRTTSACPAHTARSSARRPPGTQASTSAPPADRDRTRGHAALLRRSDQPVRPWVVVPRPAFVGPVRLRSSSLRCRHSPTVAGADCCAGISASAVPTAAAAFFIRLRTTSVTASPNSTASPRASQENRFSHGSATIPTE